MNDKEIAAKLRRLEEENINLKNWNRQLESELSAKRDEAKELKETLNRAKDIRPWQRPNFRNVKQMAKRAFLDVVKVAGGWVVKMGNRVGKKFKTLREIWLILTREEWNLHDEFLPYEEVEQQVEAVEQPPIPNPHTPIPTPHTPTDRRYPHRQLGDFGQAQIRVAAVPIGQSRYSRSFSQSRDGFGIGDGSDALAPCLKYPKYLTCPEMTSWSVRLAARLRSKKFIGI